MAQSAHAEAVGAARHGAYWRARAEAELQASCPAYLPGGLARSGAPAGDPNTGR